jgi:hypothetical protein
MEDEIVRLDELAKKKEKRKREGREKGKRKY